MKNNYGNLFYDSMLLGELWKYRAVGGELGEKRENKLIEKIKIDREMHRNDIIPFTYNEIDRVYNLAIRFDTEWHKVFDFLINLNNSYKDKDSRLKALAKLYNLFKKVGYNTLNIMLSSSMVYCYALSNEDNIEKLDSVIFNYSLPNITMHLLEELTPNEVYGLFPIDKEYDGYKLETKDYYSCMKEVEEIGLNSPMNCEQVKHFIMECDTHNFIFHIGVGIMDIVSDFNGWDIYDMLENFRRENPRLRIIK